MFFPNHMTNLTSRNWNLQHQVAHPPAPAWSPNQCPSNNVPDEADISGWWWQFVQQKRLVGSLGVGPWNIFGKILLEGRYMLLQIIYVMMIRIGKTSNQSLVFTKLYIYFQGSSKVVNIQFFTLFKPYHNCLEILKPKPRTNSPTVAPRSSPSNLRPEGPNSGSWQ